VTASRRQRKASSPPPSALTPLGAAEAAALQANTESEWLTTEDGEYCTGFVFRYFSAGKRGERVETKPKPEARQAEEIIMQRVAYALKHRPDWMEALCCLDNGVEVRLYQGTGFKDEELELYLFGRTTVHGDDVILEFATDEVINGGRDIHSDVMDVVIHELVHLIDYLDDEDGLLPGWTDDDGLVFWEQREHEWQLLRDNKPTPLVPYALTNEVEFLAVLGEAFFMRPDDLKAHNPILFNLMHKFFYPGA